MKFKNPIRAAVELAKRYGEATTDDVRGAIHEVYSRYFSVEQKAAFDKQRRLNNGRKSN